MLTSGRGKFFDKSDAVANLKQIGVASVVRGFCRTRPYICDDYRHDEESD
jgi:hypothetical protein